MLAGSYPASGSPASQPAPNPAEAPPLLEDDLNLAGLVSAAETSLRIMAGRDGAALFTLCGRDYSLARLRRGLEDFTAAARQAAKPGELAAYVAENFILCPSGGEPWAGRAFLTGYYAPELAGSLERSERFRYPLYAPPPDLLRRDGQAGRLVEGRLEPYWSRAEIENGDLLTGHELVYLEDPLAVFSLHVQGSGRIRLPDGSLRPVGYAAKSGREYRSIGRLLVAEGRLSLTEADWPGIQRYLRAHPEELTRVLHHNESYIFFRWNRPDEPGPLGSFGLPLTAGRSLALDQAHYPPGMPAYLAGTKPEIAPDDEIAGWRPFGRFVFNQDSGSAIRGPGRADLFWGSDRAAEIAAGATRHPADLFLLLPRDPA
ncbi:murein transglycosylase A [Desulfurivibrio sp. C05AmB]|uniref:murein transglycosylase A n=1 Tax=Desulfurivibrio sp. C05AmB TaxID=3374371 RepID=UPI00376EA1D3